ncbi:MAG: class I SAM-dependent methyltransferase [Chloroflexi bacterium]|nr:class I SAM-dependent methyltransferase [Chloroflexota bacterium]
MSSQQYFEDVAPQWDTMRTSFFSTAVRERALAAAGVSAGKLAADIGAGSGFVTEALLNAGLRVIAVDQSQAMLEVMQQKFGGQPLTCRLGTAEALPLDSASVDYVFANMFLHHVENPLTAIREMARLLKPGGKLVITDLDSHTFEFLREEHHDRWMGFARADVSGWFEQVGLSGVSVGDAECQCCADSACGSQRAEVTIFLACGVK